MPDIEVEAVGPDRYRVNLTEGGTTTTHLVTVDAGNPSLGVAEAEDLVDASFRFLLDREPKESILPEFDLGVIARYFPEYESRIGDYLG